MKLRLIFVLLFFFISFSVNAQDPCNEIKSEISSYEQIISDYEEDERSCIAAMREHAKLPHNEETPIKYNYVKDKLDIIKKAKSEAIATKTRLEADLRACEKS